MLKFDNGGQLVEDVCELPRLTNAKNLYCDFETTSFDPKQEAFKPYHGHRIAGICITADDLKPAWYIPIRCNHEKWNLPLKPVLKWLDKTINSCEDWVNQSVKFDAHFAKQDDIDFNCRLVDTMVLAKLIQSDRYSYGLSALSFEWLEEDISPLEKRLKAYLSGCKSKDYGDVPGDIIGEYGCQDVFTARKLYKYALRRRQDQVKDVWETEIKLTPVLFDMEVTGLRVDPQELAKKQLTVLYQLSLLEEELHTLTEFPIRPHTNEDCYEVMCNKYGLPVLGRTDKGDPSFDKDTLTSYRAHPLVSESENLTTIVKKIQRYRKLHTLHNFFIAPYREHEVDGLMHSNYNQIVRTGRLSCRRPKAQQLSPEAKELIHPLDGTDFIRWDYSQIEFRLIVHYIQDVAAIKAYNENPDTDFHLWVAEMCSMPRKPAKNVNFAVAYGGGKRKVVTMLASNMTLVGYLQKKVEELIKADKIDVSQRQQVFDLLCTRKAEHVYQTYHDTLPGLKRTSKRASTNLIIRGHVYNAYGRQRHLPPVAAFRAFNTIIQSCAADVIKERTVAFAPRYNKAVRESGVLPCASVHDETLLYVPKEISNDKHALREQRDIFENTTVKFRVPIRISCGRSSTNWKEASSDEGDVEL